MQPPYRNVRRYEFIADGRKLIASPLLGPGGRPGPLIEMAAWARNIANDGAGDLGSGTATLQVSYLVDPGLATANDWMDYQDATGGKIEITATEIGRTFMISSVAPWLAINLAGASSPSFVLFVSG